MGYIACMNKYKIFLSHCTARYCKEVVSLSVISILVLYTAVGLGVSAEDGVVSTTESKSTVLLDEYGNTTITIPASGLVVPAKTMEVRAQSDGVLTELTVSEGSSVTAGSLLFAQSLPVLSAERQLAVASGNLQQLSTEIETNQSQYVANQLEIKAQSSEAFAQLRSQSDSVSIINSRLSLEVALEQTIQGLITSLDFVNQERPFFSQAEQKEFQAITQNIYGRLPNFLVGQLRYPITDAVNLRDFLTDKDTSIEDLIAISAAVEVQAKALLQLLVSAEEEFYKLENRTDDSQKLHEYIAIKSKLLENTLRLAEAETGLWRQVLQSDINSVSDQRDVAVSEIDSERQQQLVYLQSLLESRVRAVSEAELGVVSAKQSLGSVYAAWLGRVEYVHAEIGEFVTAGSPIVRLYSTETREVKMHLPAMHVRSIKAGDMFSQQGKMIGVVDRVVLEPSLGRGVVYVSVFEGGYELGEVVYGEFIVSLPEEHLRVPRNIVKFGTFGPYILRENSKYKVRITADKGDYYIVSIISEAKE